MVKSLAEHGITVCATIHSPTSYTFNLFDSLLILLRGHVAYFGANGATALDFFHNACPHVDGLIAGGNEAEWLTDVTVQADRQGFAADFGAAFAASELCASAAAEIESELSKGSDLDEATARDLAVRRDTVTPSWWAIWIFAKVTMRGD